MQSKRIKWKLREEEYTGVIQFITEELTKKAKAGELPKKDNMFLLENTKDIIKELVRNYFINKSGYASIVPNDFPTNAQYWATSRQLSKKGITQNVRPGSPDFYFIPVIKEAEEKTDCQIESMPKIKGPELINISKFIINKIKDAPREYCSVEDETGNLFLTNGNQTIVELFRQYFKESKLSEVHKKFPMNKFPSQWQLNRFHKLLYQQEFITRKGPCNASRYYIGLIPQEKESIIRKTAKSAEEMINEAVANFKEALQGIKDEEIQNKIAEAKKEIEEELKTLFDQIKVEKKEIEKMRASTRRRIIELFAEINKEGKDKLQETAVNVLGFSQKKLTDISNFLKNIQKKLEQNK